TMGHVVDALRSLWHYHVMTYDFHTGSYLRGKSHPYESGPAGWLVLSRPVAVDAQNDLPAASCGAAADSSCMREVLMLGNPVVWWSGVLAIIAGIVTWFRTRNWAMGWALLAIAATWLPWFAFMSRPIFSFYAVTVLPFTIVVMCLLVHAVYRSAPSPRARYGLWLAVGAWCVAVVVAFWSFYPIWPDALIPSEAWRQRMWFSTWISASTAADRSAFSSVSTAGSGRICRAIHFLAVRLSRGRSRFTAPTITPSAQKNA